MLVLFALVIGGMYGGYFTPTEAAGVGAFGGFVFAVARRQLSLRALTQVLVESARTTAMLFTIVIGAALFASFLNFTSLPNDLKTFVTSFDVAPIVVIIAICLIYVVLGMAMETLSMILLTVPIFFPLVLHLGFDPIWFGVLIVCVAEISMITPPVGMNIFVLSSVVPDVRTTEIWRGVAALRRRRRRADVRPDRVPDAHAVAAARAQPLSAPPSHIRTVAANSA